MSTVRRKNPTCRFYEGATIDAGSRLGRYAVLFPEVSLRRSSIGDFSYVQAETVIMNSEIGKFCSIAGGVIIGLANHLTNFVSTHPAFFDDTQPLPRFFVKGTHFPDTLPRTKIGSDVWIGQAALNRAGVLIGSGFIIGAGSVVTKDVPPYSIMGCACAINPVAFFKRKSEKIFLFQSGGI